MARIRTVKPEFWLDEDLATLPPETRLLALGLLNHADDEGYFKANPALIKAAVFPFNECSPSIQTMLNQLKKIRYVELGTGSDAKPYGRVRTFSKHQRVNRPYASVIKGLVSFSECSVNVHEQITDDSLLEKEWKRNGMEEEKERIGADAPVDCLSLFAEFWSSWPTGYGDKGSRKNAEREFLKLRPDKDLTALMCQAAVRQFQAKAQNALNGQFVSNFKHVERWIKGREWESEISIQRPVKQSRADAINEALDGAFGREPQDGVLEGSFQTVDQYGLDE
jgi:hypothetical protein